MSMMQQPRRAPATAMTPGSPGRFRLGYASSRRPAARRGYTLVELMIVVVIVGTLATLATYAVRKYIFAAKTTEAIQMIGAIKAAQENYRDETFRYLNVGNDNLEAYYPKAPSNEKTMWGGGDADLEANWRTLGVRSDSPVVFGYACVAGPQTGDPPNGHVADVAWPAPTGWWYVVEAAGDQDGDGVKSYYASSSFTDQIFFENETE
jgi:prepilin-type N-terminal cleavage/methylation domain-containing protein